LIISVATDYFNQNDPPSVERINSDWIMACSMLAAPQDLIGPLCGWDMRPEQINWLCNEATRHVSPNAIMKVNDLDIYAVSDSTRSTRGLGKKGTNRDIKLGLDQCNTQGFCKVIADPGATADILIKRIIEAGDLMMKKNNGGPPLAGTVLHVTWNLNEVFKGDKLILGTYNEIMQIGTKLFLDGFALGETAKRCFPRSVFVIGGASANWETTKEFDWYASCSQLGIMIAGSVVYTGEHRCTSLAGQKKPGDAWHFLKKEPSDTTSPANAFARDIARDCLMAQKVQSGAQF
jgi:hypothetical protein